MISDSTIALFIPILGMVLSGVILVFYCWSRHRERMTLIANGVDISKGSMRCRSNPRNVAKWGYLLVGGALGILCGTLLCEFTNLSKSDSMFACIFLFAGLGLLFYYYKEGRKSSENLT